MHFILVPINISQLTENVNDFLKVTVSLPVNSDHMLTDKIIKSMMKEEKRREEISRNKP